MRTTLAAVTASLLMLVGCAQPRHPDTKIDCKITSPEYPVFSRAHGEAGSVAVRAMFDRDGQMANVTVAKSSGYERLDAVALAAVRASVCEPLYRNGERVPFSLTQPFNFGLVN
jgi:protein TonB